MGAIPGPRRASTVRGRKQLSEMKFVTLTVFLLAMTASAHAALRYQGKVHSYMTRGTLQMRTVLYPTGDPNTWAGTFRCHSLTRGVVCLRRYDSLVVEFDPSDGTFVHRFAGSICEGDGTGTPFSALSGRYTCINGDAGWFFFRLR
jgi:hypothetical protein